MKIVRRLLLGIAILLLLISAVGLLFFPSHVEISRSVTLQATPHKVFNYLNAIRNFNKWTPWYEMDPVAEYVFEGPSSGKGATMKWKSDSANVGNGYMTITEAFPDSVIRQDLNFMENGIAKGEFYITPVDSGTVVKWKFSVEAGANPLMRILGAFMDKMIGNDFEKGLAKLKVQLERGSDWTVEQVEVPRMDYLSVRSATTTDSVSVVLGKSYAMIVAAMQKQGLKFAGAPFAIYHTAPPSLDLEAAIPVDRPGVITGEVKSGKLDSCKALKVRYFGPYDKIASAYSALQGFMTESGMKATGSPWESYVTDPASEKDTAKWETDVYYPVK
jgi:effector-binding domain-containing protein/uncharacterized protein YndB with AHSA1/START domain